MRFHAAASRRQVILQQAAVRLETGGAFDMFRPWPCEQTRPNMLSAAGATSRRCAIRSCARRRRGRNISCTVGGGQDSADSDISVSVKTCGACEAASDEPIVRRGFGKRPASGLRQTLRHLVQCRRWKKFWNFWSTRSKTTRRRLFASPFSPDPHRSMLGCWRDVGSDVLGRHGGGCLRKGKRNCNFFK